jgi:hypothetical protein
MIDDRDFFDYGRGEPSVIHSDLVSEGTLDQLRTEAANQALLSLPYGDLKHARSLGEGDRHSSGRPAKRKPLK